MTRFSREVHPHTFRHTCASMLFASGKNIRQVWAWMGHSYPAFTMRVYVGLLDGDLGDVSFLDDVLEPPAAGASGT